MKPLVPALALTLVAGGAAYMALPSTGQTASVPAAPPAVVGAPALAQVAIPVPPVVTGLPYPSACTMRHTDTGEVLPDPVCTPGSVNPAVTQANIKATICVRGWTRTVRPPASNTEPVKRAAMKAYGLPSDSTTTDELDHDVPLELGGSGDVSNLWPESSDLPGQGFRNRKDTVENDLRAAVCNGTVTLDAARAAIATDWTTAEQKLGLK